MDINAISNINLPTSNAFNQKTVPQKTTEQSSPIVKTESKKHNKLPYVAGAVVLAGLGVYAFRGKFSKMFKQTVKNSDDIKDFVNKTKDEPIVTKIEEELPEIEKAVQVAVREIGEDAPKVPKSLCTGFKDGQPIFSKVEIVNITEIPVAKSYSSILLEKAESLLNDDMMNVIRKNREEQSGEITRIISENLNKEGNIIFGKLNNVARDFARDETNRGANRFHQAADILEQAYVKQFIKGDEKVKEGLGNFADLAIQESNLFEIYAHMEPEEVLSRLKYLAQNELKSETYKGINSEQFVEKCFDRFSIKKQFQDHNKAKGIKDTFLYD